MAHPASLPRPGRLAPLRRSFDAASGSALGRFLGRLLEDDVPRLAVLLAWGSLTTLMPLLITVSGFGSLILRDPTVANRLSQMLTQALPGTSAGLAERALEQARERGVAAGVIGLVLLIWNGTSFFANLASVVNIVYRVEDRNLVVQRVLGLGILLAMSVVLALSTVLATFSSLLDSTSEFLQNMVPDAAVSHPVLTEVLGWLVPQLAIVLSFLALYRILPNCRVRWRDVLPGAAAAAVAFFLILRLFPLYLSLFGRGFEVYAAFGSFLLLMFWTYLLGIVLVVGVEINVFLSPSGVVGTRRSPLRL
ncbi:MAG: YihY/virulence factor BrkB family protein [Chloroflexi bacterium]|nr:YihY/virulence factor BrkB family protein [Chloroflexota bacterium]